MDNLYKTLLYSSKEFIKSKLIPVDEQINDILIKGTNMQDNIKLMKTLYKNGII